LFFLAVVLFAEGAGAGGGVADQLWGRVGSSGLADKSALSRRLKPALSGFQASSLVGSFFVSSFL
jgi:hypothetical protein